MSDYWSALLRAARGPVADLSVASGLEEVELEAGTSADLRAVEAPAEPLRVPAIETPEPAAPPMPSAQAVEAAPRPDPPPPASPPPGSQDAGPAPPVAETHPAGPLSAQPSTPTLVAGRVIAAAPRLPIPPTNTPAPRPQIVRDADPARPASVPRPAEASSEADTYAETAPAPAPMPVAIVARAAPAAVPPVPPAGKDEAPSPVMLTIERIDIRVTPPPASPPPPRGREPSPGPSLADYLAGRGR